MTGWRIGMAVGNPDLVEGLAQAKSNLDSGIFQAVQEAGIDALKLGDTIVEPSRKIYQERRDILVDGLRAVGLECEKPRATFYVWVSTPKGLSSAEFTAKLLDDAGVVTDPREWIWRGRRGIRSLYGLCGQIKAKGGCGKNPAG